MCDYDIFINYGMAFWYLVTLLKRLWFTQGVHALGFLRLWRNQLTIVELSLFEI